MYENWCKCLVQIQLLKIYIIDYIVSNIFIGLYSFFVTGGRKKSKIRTFQGMLEYQIYIYIYNIYVVRSIDLEIARERRTFGLLYARTKVFYQSVYEFVIRINLSYHRYFFIIYFFILNIIKLYLFKTCIILTPSIFIYEYDVRSSYHTLVYHTNIK